MSKACLTPFVRMTLFACAMAFLLAGSLNVAAQTATGEIRVVQVGVQANAGGEDPSLPCAPLTQYLSTAIPGCRFEVVPLSRDQITAKVRSNAVDFIIVDPAFLARLKSRDGFEAIATLQSQFKGTKYALSGGTLFYRPETGKAVRQKDTRGLFTLPEKSEPVHPRDLKGRSIAFAESEAIPGWQAVVREFHRIGFKTDRDLKATAVGSDEDVVGAVLKGEVEAGCVRAGALERAVAEQKLDKDVFRVIEFADIRDTNFPARIPVAVSTRLYPDISFVACPRAAPDLVGDMAAALLAMPPWTDQAGERPEVIGWTFPRSDLAVHECLQDLRIPPYEHFGEITFREVSHQYMYWLIGLGTLMILLVLITLYVLVLDPAPWRAILERKRAESALYISVKRFEHIASCSGDWIWETDASDQFTYSNAIVEQMLGYKQEEIIGKRPFDLFAAAEKERITALGQKKFGTGARMFRERFRLLTKDGRVVIHETTAEPITDSRGQFAGYRGVSRDITNQVRFVRLRP